MRFRFDLLGPLRASRNGQSVALGSVKQRLLLASLLLRPNETVSTDELMAMLWAGDPPVSAAANLRTYAHGLRLALGDPAAQRMPTVSGGYLLRLAPDERDLDQFDTAAARGREALADGDLARATTELATAVDLWRGAPLADLPLPPRLARQATQLLERQLLAEEDYAEARLLAGAPGEVVHRLRVLLDRHPLRQRAWGQLMVARYRTGDVAGALAAFREARQLLAAETGLDPGPELCKLHDDILHCRPAAMVGPTPRPGPDCPAPGSGSRSPAQLPLAASDFVGRQAELAQLDACLDEWAGGPTTVVISAVSGMAGIGKTALALRWAHQVAGRFSDGQLYVNLRGYDDADAVSPADALLGFLEALEVPLARIPSSTDARAGLYRSLLASRQMLVVLDNARDSDQVRPLLPGAGRCVVVVTSRDHLRGLVSAEGAKPLTLGVLSDEESLSLLGCRIDRDRLAAEPAAVAEIIEATGRLPLALSIVAARMATRSTFPLSAFAAELCPSGTGPGMLVDHEIRKILSWSYRALSKDAARLFRLLGLHPGPDLTGGVAAALAGESLTAVTPSLRELAQLHLLTEHLPGRYALHDLLRTYAAELAQSSEQAEGRKAAYQRLYDYYLHSAHPAARLLQPHWIPIIPVPPLPTNVSPPVADHGAALVWFATERRVLLRLVRQAAETGFPQYAWQLAWALTTFLSPRGYWPDQLAVQRVAVAAAEELGDLGALAIASRLLSRAAFRLGQYDDAEYHIRRALDLFGQLSDLTGEAQTRHNYTEHCHLLGRSEEALLHAREALRLHRLAGSRPGEGRALNAIGYLYASAGDCHQAIINCTEALVQQRRIDDCNGQAATLDTLGLAYAKLGDHDRATFYYQESIHLFRASADRFHEAETLIRLGETREAMADLTAAAEAFRRAEQIYDELGDSAADEARRRLARIKPG